MGKHVLSLGLASGVECKKSVSDDRVALGSYLCRECGGLCVREGVESDDGEDETVGEVGVETGSILL